MILAIPAPRLARLIEDVAPRSMFAAASRITSASSVVVALAVPGDTAFPECSGVLVASGEQLRARRSRCRRANGALGGDVQFLRLSFGRFGDDLAASRLR